jgi:hypothetical protein
MFTKKHQSQENAHCAAQDKQVKRHMKKQAVDKSAGHAGHVFAK